MKEIMGIYGPGREQYTKRMAANLPMLRMKLGLSQTELAELMGVTRQTVSAVENGVRPLSWTGFLSLLFIFMQNSETKPLLKVLAIYTDELAHAFVITDLDKLK